MTTSHTVSRRQFLSTSAATLALVPALRSTAFAAESQLIVRSADPYNAEPALDKLVNSAITPVDQFFVRIHGPTQKVEPASLQVHIDGLVGKPGQYSLADLKGRFPAATTEATLTCGGNRRQEQSAIKPVPGVQWDVGATGNATWTGVKLSEVLKSAEIKPAAKHVWFEGLDHIKQPDGSTSPFGGSIPLEKALAADAAALLAHTMNGQPLTTEHGAPLRAVVPGYIGARSVKWLTKITLSDRPSPNHYVAEAYKVTKTDAKAELAATDPIYDMPVNVAICTPAAGAQLNSRRVTVRGYALPSGQPGTTVERVELSPDGGRTWKRAELQGDPRPYQWCLWTAELELAPGQHELVAKATDSRGHATPQRGAWNPKGYMYNGWHHVAINVTA